MKSFMMLLAVFVVLGVSLGGAFAGGVALGKSQGDDTVAGSSGLRPASSPQQQASGQSGQGELAQIQQRFQSGETGPEDLAQLRQQFQSGEISPEDLAQIRQRFQSGETGSRDASQIRQRLGQGFGGRGALTGTINKVEGTTVTVDTPQGPQPAVIGDETTIGKFAAGTPVDLQEGTRVIVIGQPGEGGAVEATSILLVPEGVASLFGGGTFFGER